MTMVSYIATAKTALAIAINFLLHLQGAHGQPFDFFSYIGVDFFSDDKSNGSIEASGLDIAPDGSHLVVASDNGKLIFLNLYDYESGHCLIDIDEDLDNLVAGGTDFEGVAFDPAIWDATNMHVYVVHEGADDDDPYLYKILYTYDNNGNCGVTQIDSVPLVNAIPCLKTGNGVESLALKSESTEDDPAVFFVGIQDTGKVYEITSTGLSNGPYCYDGGLDFTDIADSYYIQEKGHLWSFFDDNHGELVVVDPFHNRKLATYDTDLKDEEGLAIDYEKGLMYIASDEGGEESFNKGKSYVAIYNFTYPEGLGGCSDGGVSTQSCVNLFTGCGFFENNPIQVENTCPQPLTSQPTTTTIVGSTSATSASTITTPASTTAATTTASSTTKSTTTSSTCALPGDGCNGSADCCGNDKCGRKNKTCKSKARKLTRANM